MAPAVGMITRHPWQFRPRFKRNRTRESPWWNVPPLLTPDVRCISVRGVRFHFEGMITAERFRLDAVTDAEWCLYVRCRRNRPWRIPCLFSLVDQSTGAGLLCGAASGPTRQGASIMAARGCLIRCPSRPSGCRRSARTASLHALSARRKRCGGRVEIQLFRNRRRPRGRSSHEDSRLSHNVLFC
jgi:hypothetical protein